MDFGIIAGDTSKTIYVRLRDSTTGLAKTGLVYNSAGAVASYILPLAARAAITLATQTVTGAWSSGGFVEVDATNAKGIYRLDLPDAAIASGAFSIVTIQFTGVIEEAVEIELHTRKTNVTQWLGTAAATPTVAGVPEVDLTHVAGATTDVSALATNVAAILVDTGTTLDGRIPAALVGGRIDANVGAISSDATAADNAEAFFDGTGYAGTGNVIPTVTTLTNLPAITANWITTAGITDGAFTAAKFAAASLNGKGDWNVGKTGYSLTATTGLGNQTADITGTITTVTTLTGHTPQTGDSYAIVNSGTHGNAAIKGFVDDIGTAGAGLTAIPWNAAWDAEVQSEVDDALVVQRLDELLNADSDIDGAAPPTVGSVFHELMSKTAGSFTFDQTTDSNEALRDRGDAAWITATGFATPTNITSATGIVLAGVTHTGAVIPTVSTLTGHTAQTGDSYAIVNSGTHGNAALKTLIDTVDNFVDTEVSSIKTVTDNLATAIELDGAVYRFTTNALEQAPTAGGPSAATIADAVWDELRADHVAAGSFGQYTPANATFWAGVATASDDVAIATLADVWAYTSRTLTQTVQAAGVAAVITSGKVTVYRSGHWSIAITGLGSLVGYTRTIFTVKSNHHITTDATAAVQIDSVTGLLVINGATAGTAANGSLTVNDATLGNITVVLKDTESDKLTEGIYYYDVRGIDGSGNAQQKAAVQVLEIVHPVTRAIA